MLGVYNELVALRRLSIALRRRCDFLENVQSLLRSQNAMLVEMVVGKTESTADMGQLHFCQLQLNYNCI